jgi:hypothetical protein
MFLIRKKLGHILGDFSHKTSGHSDAESSSVGHQREQGANSCPNLVRGAIHQNSDFAQGKKHIKIPTVEERSRVARFFLVQNTKT